MKNKFDLIYEETMKSVVTEGWFTKAVGKLATLGSKSRKKEHMINEMNDLLRNNKFSNDQHPQYNPRGSHDIFWTEINGHVIQIFRDTTFKDNENKTDLKIKVAFDKESAGVTTLKSNYYERDIRDEINKLLARVTPDIRLESPDSADSSSDSADSSSDFDTNSYNEQPTASNNEVPEQSSSASQPAQKNGLYRCRHCGRYIIDMGDDNVCCACLLKYYFSVNDFKTVIYSLADKYEKLISQETKVNLKFTIKQFILDNIGKKGFEKLQEMYENIYDINSAQMSFTGRREKYMEIEKKIFGDVKGNSSVASSTPKSKPKLKLKPASTGTDVNVEVHNDELKEKK